MTELIFVNHASVAIKDKDICLLSDPWYFGSAFHNGWNLLYENTEEEILGLLSLLTHIWISHEHPDHFSIGFFKKYKRLIKSRGIKILFQKTKDQRVVSFLTANGFDICELNFNQRTGLSADFYVTCIKDGFYDSALYTETTELNFLNLNDCEIKTKRRAKEVKRHIGSVDVLLTQFSYAAWKGNKDNKQWREMAAQEKIDTMQFQMEYFRPKYTIPFASHIYFSNKDNFYLNDSVNTIEKVNQSLNNIDSNLILMRPMEKYNFCESYLFNDDAIRYWNDLKIKNVARNTYESVIFDDLQEQYDQYRSRIKKRNNIFLIKLLKYLSPVRVFQPLTIRLTDQNYNILIDLFNEGLMKTTEKADIDMHSSMLSFIFMNTFGFDTLTVNGCFQESKKGGFVKMAKLLAIENLNNLGINVRFSLLINIDVISMFLVRLYRVARKLES